MIKFLLYIVSLVTSCFSIAPTNEIAKYEPTDIQLHNTIVKMDATYFDAYNTCDMKTQANIYAEEIEFFHDKGGLATNKEDLLVSLQENICGKVTRTLIKGSIEVYPIPNYGAVQIGYHRFFNKEEPNAPIVPGKFIAVWKSTNSSWKITKVIRLHADA